MKNLLIRDLTDEQLDMFINLAGLRLVNLVQHDTIIDLEITTDPRFLIVMELEP